MIGWLADWLRELGSPYEFHGGHVNDCLGHARDLVSRVAVFLFCCGNCNFGAEDVHGFMMFNVCFCFPIQLFLYSTP